MMERSNAVSSSVVDEDQITRLHETLTTKDERFEVFEWRESDDDDQTESTSRTEDDPVGDAFRQVLAAELEDDDDDDDEIVWNPRYVCSFVPLLPARFESFFFKTHLFPCQSPDSTRHAGIASSCNCNDTDEASFQPYRHCSTIADPSITLCKPCGASFTHHCRRSVEQRHGRLSYIRWKRYLSFTTPV